MCDKVQDGTYNNYVKRIAVSPSLAISKTQLLEYIYAKYLFGSFDNLPHILTTVSVTCWTLKFKAFRHLCTIHLWGKIKTLELNWLIIHGRQKQKRFKVFQGLVMFCHDYLSSLHRFKCKSDECKTWCNITSLVSCSEFKQSEASQWSSMTFACLCWLTTVCIVYQPCRVFFFLSAL